MMPVLVFSCVSGVLFVTGGKGRDGGFVFVLGILALEFLFFCLITL